MEHLLRTWHPRTRPDEVELDPALTWSRLQIHHTEGGQPGATTGVVEFTVSYRRGGKPGELHERSRFETRVGRWWYVDGAIDR